MAKQHTIGSSVSLSGIGLHTGEKATVTLNAAPENYGIRFVRSDVPNSPEIPALLDYVVDLARGTTIGINEAKVSTIEHLMAAFAGMEIDNCRVEVSASEIPLMDGSSLPFIELLEHSGIVEQDADRQFIVIDKPMMLYQKGEVAYGVFPSDHFYITLLTDYGHKHPAVGVQHTTMFSLKDFAKEFAPSRTFCFLSEIEMLREKGLIKGGNLHSAVVVQDVELSEDHIDYIKRLFPDEGPITPGTDGFLNGTKLRFPNELCRHKALDLIGDLYLLGKPVLGLIQAARTSHAANHEMAKKIREHLLAREELAARKKNSYDVQDILTALPHRYPFLLIDKIVDVVPDKSAVCIKNVTFNEPFFQGHFPGNPVMPGVLQVEAMAQAGGIMGTYGKDSSEEKVMYFMAVDKVRFRQIVRPGDCLRIEVKMLQNRRGTIKFAGKCFVEDKLVCEAELMAMLAKKEG